MIPTIFKAGIKLKFPQERKEQRILQQRFEPSLYLSPVVSKFFCELTCNNGIYSFQNGKIPDGKYIFIRTLEGEILAAKEEDIAHHSYLSNGKKVLSAGGLVFEKGTLCLVSNESGHYTPTNEEMLSEIKLFYSISQNQELIYEDHSKVPAQQRISHYKARNIFTAESIEEIEPIATFHKNNSKYGKQLKVPARDKLKTGQAPENQASSIHTDLSFFSPARKGHYNDQNQLDSSRYDEHSQFLIIPSD